MSSPAVAEDDARMTALLDQLDLLADAGKRCKVDLFACPQWDGRDGWHNMWEKRVQINGLSRLACIVEENGKTGKLKPTKTHPLSEDLLFLQRYIASNIRAKAKCLPDDCASRQDDPCEYFLQTICALFWDTDYGVIRGHLGAGNDAATIVVPSSGGGAFRWNRPGVDDALVDNGDNRTVIVLWKASVSPAYERIRCRVRDLLNIMPPQHSDSGRDEWRCWSHAMQWTWDDSVNQGVRITLNSAKKKWWPDIVFGYSSSRTAEALESSVETASQDSGEPDTDIKAARRKPKREAAARSSDVVADHADAAATMAKVPMQKKHKRLKQAKGADSAAPAKDAVDDPDRRYEFNDPRYLETHASDAAWSLPIMIELTCERHMYMQGVKLLAILWYADPYVKAATHKHQDDAFFEAFHWRKDTQGKDSLDDESSRSGFFHQVVHVETLAPAEEGGGTPAHPTMQLAGLFFSSFHTVPRLLDMNVSGWDAWKVHSASGETMRKIVLGIRQRQFINPAYLEQPFAYPNCLIDRRIIDMSRQPTFAPRDLLVNICRQECNAVRCAPMTWARIAEYKEAYKKPPPTVYCVHGIAHYAPEEIDLELDRRTRAQRNLDVQLTAIGRTIRFDDAKFAEFDYIVPELLRYPFWTLELMRTLERLQQFKFPQTYPLRQQFHRSWNDDLLVNNVDALKMLFLCYKPLTYLSYSRPCRRSKAPWIERKEERADMVIIVEWEVRRVQFRMLDKWRGDDLENGDGGTLVFMVEVSTLEKALKGTKYEMTDDVVQELFDEVLSKKHYDALEQKAAAADAELDRVKASNDEHKHLLLVSAESAVRRAHIELEYADDRMHVDSSQHEMDEYQKEQRDLVDHRRRECRVRITN